MERPETPWAPSEAVLELEFQRRALGDIRDYIRDFAKEKNITYEVEKEPDTLVVRPKEGDSSALRTYAEGMVNTLNETLKNHKKGFLFVVDDQADAFAIRAVGR